MSADVRCEQTDLLVIQCAHCLAQEDDRPIRAVSMFSLYKGRCACCEEPFEANQRIAYSSDVEGWCLFTHTRPAENERPKPVPFATHGQDRCQCKAHWFWHEPTPDCPPLGDPAREHFKMGART